MGFAFRQGDIPSGRFVGASVPEVQATVKNRWPDGSVKFAIIAGRASVSAGTPTTVALSASATAPGGTALSTADLKATGITASVSAGAFGSASWSGADWDTAAQTWVSGPYMSSWTYRRQIGSDAHLVAWLEVRLYQGGAVEVLPWVENCYLLVAGPTNKSAAYAFSLGGTQRYSATIDLPNHCRTPLVAGAALSHWLGTDPAVTPRHDTAYLQSTRLVPGYSATVPPSTTAVTAQPATYSALQQGNHPTAMGTSGYHSSIGLLPEWDVLYLTSTASTLWASLQRNAYSSGRYGIHFRDESTQRPLRFSQHPNLVLGGGSGVSDVGSGTGPITPAATGAVGAAYKNSHCPSFGYLAYLVTGRLYHLETLQFQATLHYLKNGNVTRAGAAGILRSDAGANTTRGAAWALRTLAQAASASPDEDVLQTEFTASFEANVNYYHSRYVGQSHNPYGWVTPYSDYTSGDGVYFEATWMQDFFTAAIGMAKSLRLAMSASGSTKLDAFFAWKAKSIVGRFGGTGSNEFLYRDAAPYTIAVAAGDAAVVSWSNGAGPWLASWGASYDATYAAASPGPRTEGNLRGGYYPDATSYWGNLQPALAYAVEHDVPGAAAAYSRMTGAPNWGQILSDFNSKPVWSVQPRGG